MTRRQQRIRNRIACRKYYQKRKHDRKYVLRARQKALTYSRAHAEQNRRRSLHAYRQKKHDPEFRSAENQRARIYRQTHPLHSRLASQRYYHSHSNER